MKPKEELRNAVHTSTHKCYGAIFCQYILLFDLLDSLERIYLINCGKKYAPFLYKKYMTNILSLNQRVSNGLL